MTDSMHLVLLVEDDESLQKVLRLLFEAHGYRVLVTGTAAGGIHDSRLYNPDLAIIDLGLPDGDGLDVIKQIRSWSPMSILVLSARTAEKQRLDAFEAGADDYVLKPFSAPELMARVRAMSRRLVRGDSPNAVLQLGDIFVDLSDRTAVRSGGEPIRITPLEFRILAVLARQPDRIVTHARLIKEVWGPDRQDPGSLRVFIASLRRKLEPDPSRPKHILTELGLGYRLVLAQAAQG